MSHQDDTHMHQACAHIRKEAQAMTPPPAGPEITDAMVEAACAAWWFGYTPHVTEWGPKTPKAKEEYRQRMKVALKAALSVQAGEKA